MIILSIHSKFSAMMWEMLCSSNTWISFFCLSVNPISCRRNNRHVGSSMGALSSLVGCGWISGIPCVLMGLYMERVAEQHVLTRNLYHWLSGCGLKQDEGWQPCREEPPWLVIHLWLQVQMKYEDQTYGLCVNYDVLIITPVIITAEQSKLETKEYNKSKI